MLEKSTHDGDDLPDDIVEMLNILPLEVRTDVEEEWSADQHATLMADVRAIILESLQTKGGTAT